MNKRPSSSPTSKHSSTPPLPSSTDPEIMNGIKPKVRLVLFDVFDTLCTPRIPVHEQYALEAQAAGIRSVTPLSVRAGFKPAFKEMLAAYPLYGKHSQPPLTPEAWWTDLVRKCLRHAGASQSELAKYGDIAANNILDRFETDVGYRNFPETIATLKGLRDRGVKTSVVSNADPRILITLSALGLEDYFTSPPTLSWNVEFSKPQPEIFLAACNGAHEEPGQGVIMVGDELEADFHGATRAGLEARLVRRPGEWSDGAIREAEEDLGGVNVVQNLREVIAEVDSRNGQTHPGEEV